MVFRMVVNSIVFPTANSTSCSQCDNNLNTVCVGGILYFGGRPACKKPARGYHHFLNGFFQLLVSINVIRFEKLDTIYIYLSILATLVAEWQLSLGATSVGLSTVAQGQLMQMNGVFGRPNLYTSTHQGITGLLCRPSSCGIESNGPSLTGPDVTPHNVLQSNL